MHGSKIHRFHLKLLGYYYLGGLFVSNGLVVLFPDNLTTVNKCSQGSKYWCIFVDASDCVFSRGRWAINSE